MKSYWNRKRILIKSNLYKIIRIPPSSYKSNSLPIVRANNSWKKRKKFFFPSLLFYPMKERKLSWPPRTSAMRTCEVEAVPVAASGSTLLRFSPLSRLPIQPTSFLSCGHFTIARHVVTLSEPRETCGFTCLFVILPPPFVRSDDLMLHFVSFSVSRRNIWIYYGIFVIFFCNIVSGIC